MKYSRHSKILELIENNEIDTQEDLAKSLRESGYNITQATVSRDIKELKLIKVLGKSGKYKYASLEGHNSISGNRFLKIFKDSVLSVNSSNNIIVIRTLSGAANAAAAAIDSLKMDEIIGCIAGDDTIFLLISEDANVENLKRSFMDMTV